MDDAVALPDRRWAMWSGIIGLIGIPSYALLVFADVPLAIGVVLTFTFAFGLAVSSLGLHLGVTRRVAPNIGMVASIATIVGTAQLVAMLLVQMAVRAAAGHPSKEFIAIWLGLDVAWDLFAGTGLLLFGVALAMVPGFSRLLGWAGVVLSGTLLVLNIAYFPAPPGEAGSVDVGPFVALWYLVVMIRVLVLSRRNVQA